MKLVFWLEQDDGARLSEPLQCVFHLRAEDLSALRAMHRASNSPITADNLHQYTVALSASKFPRQVIEATCILVSKVIEKQLTESSDAPS